MSPYIAPLACDSRGAHQPVQVTDDQPRWVEPICRRAIINSPSGKLVEIEVIPAAGQDYVGLALQEQLPWGYDFPSRVTVSGGVEVWIVVRQERRVTVVATE